VAAGGSPFVLIFHSLDSNGVANVLNFVVLIAAISVYNSCVYCNTRMLHGLAMQGNAPKALMKVNQRGIPINATWISSMVTALVVVVNYMMPSEAFGFLMMLVVAALMINWLMIAITHLKFTKAMRIAQHKTAFKALFSPWSNYLTIAFMLFILLVMSLTPGMRLAVYLIPVWLITLSIVYYVKIKKTNPQLQGLTTKS